MELLTLPEELKQKRKIISDINKIIYPEAKNNFDTEILTLEKGELKKISNGNFNKGKIYADNFEFLSKENVKKLKNWGITEICIFVYLINGYVPFRTHSFEKLNVFSKKSNEEISLIVCLILVFFFLIFILYPQIFK